MAEQFITIKLTKCLLFLTEDEVLSLLRANPLIWERALRRGKFIRRAAKAREPKGKIRA
ncbi:MAG: hypothetical protein K6U04_08950 [Armatimonadetes bacterium]|nr:hypothetical protein [Armatimonadota bacterium]